MQKYIYLMLLGVGLGFSGKAQYVTLPDTTFVNWLKSNGYDSCFIGNQLDTTCGGILNVTYFNCSEVFVHDITGIQYFKNVTSLFCEEDSLFNIPQLPPGLQMLYCDMNNIAALPVLPISLTYLDCNYNMLTSLPVLPSKLQILYCEGNHLDSLPALPDSLLELYCQYNTLSSLPHLPNKLQYLLCDYNGIDSLPILPPVIYSLSCSYNQLTGLPVLPNSLGILNCDNNSLISLPSLAHLGGLSCAENRLYNLPVLPASLGGLTCYGNHLDTLPPLPANLTQLLCDNNQLTAIPALPEGLEILSCSHNQLSSIPALPDTLQYFICNNNPNLACLPKLTKIYLIEFDSTAVECIPNLGNVLYSTPSLDSVPLCNSFNPNGCLFTLGIVDESINQLPITLYPNPARDYTIVSVSDNLIGSWLQLSDAVGRVVSRQRINSNKYRLQTGALVKGVYLVKVVGSNGGETVKKLVIQ